MHSQATRTLVLAGMPPPWVYRHPRRRYVEQKILATPPWVSHRDMLEFYAERDRLNGETGVAHSVDHIVPLSHPMVCGLNVPWNLRVITKAQNDRKGNRWHPDQLEMF